MSSSEKVQEHPTDAPDAHEHLTTGVKRKRWTPLFLHPAVEAIICFSFLAMAIGLEVMLYYNRKQSGFPVPLKNHNSIVQFLKSFIPTLAFLPLVFCLAKVYAELRALQPYIDLSHGPAPAERTVTLEYVSKGAFETVRASYKHHHWILTVASIILLYSGLFTSLAGSLFAIKLHEFISTNTNTTTGTLGLANISAVTYSGAAGYTSTSVYNEQTLPPFTFLDEAGPDTDGWMIPPFRPAPGVPTTSEGVSLLQVNTQALQFHVDCVPGQVTQSSTDGGLQFVSSLGNNELCGLTATIGKLDGSWVGDVHVVDASCVSLINTTAPPTNNMDRSTVPVAFTFIKSASASSVAYCYGYRQVFNVTATADLKVGRAQTNMTGIQYVPNHPLEGFVINGLADEDASTDTYQIVGNTLASAVILRAGITDPSDININQTLQDQILGAPSDTLAAHVASVYLAYQLAAATSVYVNGPQAFLNGIHSNEKGRILAIKPAVHTLAVLCLITSFAFFILFILDARQRRDLYLIDRPRPSIARIGSLLSPSSFDPPQVAGDVEHGMRPPFATRPTSSIFEVVGPTHTHKQMKENLRNRSFSLGQDGVVAMTDAK